jgi:hypothetical protein
MSVINNKWVERVKRMKIVKSSYNYNFLYTLGLLFLLVTDVQAQQGGKIFETAACNLLGQVLTQNFGAMLTVFSGLMALFSAVVGSFRMAWVLVFVSVGIYIFPRFVELLFPLNCPN